MDDAGHRLLGRQCVFITLSAVNVILHTTCILFLASVYKKNPGSKTQNLYLLNLSATELIANLLVLSTSTVLLTLLEIKTRDFDTMMKFYVFFSAMLILDVCRVVQYYFAMFLLTGDRLAASILKIRYNTVCTEFRAKVLIFCTWVISFLIIPSILGTLYATHRMTFASMIAAPLVWYELTSNWTYVIFTIMTYIAIIKIFLNSQRRIASPSQHQSLESCLYRYVY